MDAIIQKIDIEINNLQELKDYLIHIKGCFSKSQELGKKVKQLNLNDFRKNKVLMMVLLLNNYVSLID